MDTGRKGRKRRRANVATAAEAAKFNLEPLLFPQRKERRKEGAQMDGWMGGCADRRPPLPPRKSLKASAAIPEPRFSVA